MNFTTTTTTTMLVEPFVHTVAIATRNSHRTTISKTKTQRSHPSIQYTASFWFWHTRNKYTCMMILFDVYSSPMSCTGGTLQQP